jgi:hypothetical protein
LLPSRSDDAESPWNQILSYTLTGNRLNLLKTESAKVNKNPKLFMSSVRLFKARRNSELERIKNQDNKLNRDTVFSTNFHKRSIKFRFGE